MLELQRPAERLLHGHLLVEGEADQQRHRGADEETVRLLRVGEVEPVRSHGHHGSRNGRPRGELCACSQCVWEGVAGRPENAWMPRDHLPQALTSFLGRADEIAAVARALADHRLVTLTGPGGVGKTRLAIEAARAGSTSFREGARFVDLAPVRDGEAVAAALSAGIGGSEPRGPALEWLIEFAADQEVLVVLDNCEQVIEAVAATVEQLLRACAGVVVLATSREPLGVAGEPGVAGASALPRRPTRTRCPLPKVANLPAVELFVERAKLANGAFALTPENAPSVLMICAAVDCLPLATELAAARVRTLSVAADRGAPCRAASDALRRRAHCPRAAAHHGSGRPLELIDPLAEPEKDALSGACRCSTGGWTLEAAEGVCGAGAPGEADVLGLLDSLVERSLVVGGATGRRALSVPGGDPRVRG